MHIKKTRVIVLVICSLAVLSIVAYLNIPYFSGGVEPTTNSATSGTTTNVLTTTSGTTTNGTSSPLSFPVVSTPLTDEVISSLISEAAEYLNNEDVYLNYSQLLEFFVLRNEAVLGDSVIVDKESGIVQLQPSKQAEIQKSQTYLILLAMITEQYADSYIDSDYKYNFYYSRPPIYRLFVCTDFRESDYTHFKEYFDAHAYMTSKNAYYVYFDKPFINKLFYGETVKVTNLFDEVFNQLS